MNMLFYPDVQDFAKELIEHHLIKTKVDSPDGQGFRLKLHDKSPNAPLSPYYVDFRVMRSFPGMPRRAAELLRDLVIPGDAISFYELLADVPTAATPIVALLSDDVGIPMITPREPKKHGSQASIDGVFKTGQHVLLIDDIVTQADSKLAAAKILLDAGLNVENVAVLLDREQGGEAQLAAEGLHLRSLFTISELLEFYLQEGLIAAELIAEINAYRQNFA